MSEIEALKSSHAASQLHWGLQGRQHVLTLMGLHAKRSLFYYKRIKKWKLLHLPHGPENIRKHYSFWKLLHRIKGSHLALFLIKLRKVLLWQWQIQGQLAEVRVQSLVTGGQAQFPVSECGCWGVAGPWGALGWPPCRGSSREVLTSWLVVMFVPLVLSLHSAQVSFRRPWFWGPGFRKKQTKTW